MSEWTVVTALAVLVPLVVGIVAPIMKLNSNIVKLNVTMEAMTNKMREVEEDNRAIKEHANESHRRIHERIDGAEKKLENHDARITTLEKRGGNHHV